MKKIRELCAYNVVKGKYNLERLNPSYEFDSAYLIKMRNDLDFLGNTLLNNYFPFAQSGDPFLVTLNKIIPISGEIIQSIKRSEFTIVQDEIFAFLQDNNGNIKDKSFVNNNTNANPNLNNSPKNNESISPKNNQNTTFEVKHTKEIKSDFNIEQNLLSQYVSNTNNDFFRIKSATIPAQNKTEYNYELKNNTIDKEREALLKKMEYYDEIAKGIEKDKKKLEKIKLEKNKKLYPKKEVIDLDNTTQNKVQKDQIPEENKKEEIEKNKEAKQKEEQNVFEEIKNNYFKKEEESKETLENKEEENKNIADEEHKINENSEKEIIINDSQKLIKEDFEKLNSELEKMKEGEDDLENEIDFKDDEV